MKSYSNLLDTISKQYSTESDVGKLTEETIILDDENDGTTTLGKDIRTVLDRNKINYVVNTDKIIHPKTLENTVVDGVHHEELEETKLRKVKIIYDNTINVSNGADIYVVADEEMAESMESAGLKVARYPNQLIEILKK